MYGEALSSESAFNDRMSALSREIGPRGRADAAVTRTPERSPAPASATQPVGAAPSTPSLARLKSELEGMKLGALNRRAMQLGVDDAALDDAKEAGDPKAATIQL